MRRPWLRLGLGLSLLGCASGSEPPARDGPALYRENITREAELAASDAFASPDGVWSGRSSARLASPIESRGGTYYALFEIGSEVPIECFAYANRFDLATDLARQAEGALGALAEQIGALKARQIHATQAGAVAASPYLGIDWLYAIEQGGGQLGLLKERVALVGSRTLSCQHNELGYVESFERVFREVAESFEYRGPEPPEPEPAYREIALVSLAGRRIGVASTNVTRDAEGDLRADTLTALLLPIAPDRVRASDSYQIEVSRGDGTLLFAKSVRSEAGEVGSELELAPGPDGGWRVSGSREGRAFRAEFPRETLHGAVGQMLRLRAAIAAEGAGALVSLRSWSDADPSQPIEMTTELLRLRDDGDFDARLRVGPVEATGIADRAGSMRRISLDLGHAAMDFERVFADGAL